MDLKSRYSSSDSLGNCWVMGAFPLVNKVTCTTIYPQFYKVFQGEHRNFKASSNQGVSDCTILPLQILKIPYCFLLVFESIIFQKQSTSWFRLIWPNQNLFSLEIYSKVPNTFPCKSIRHTLEASKKWKWSNGILSLRCVWWHIFSITNAQNSIFSIFSGVWTHCIIWISLVRLNQTFYFPSKSIRHILEASIEVKMTHRNSKNRF